MWMQENILQAKCISWGHKVIIEALYFPHLFPADFYLKLIKLSRGCPLCHRHILNPFVMGFTLAWMSFLATTFQTSKGGAQRPLPETHKIWCKVFVLQPPCEPLSGPHALLDFAVEVINMRKTLAIPLFDAKSYTQTGKQKQIGNYEATKCTLFLQWPSI